MRIRTLLVGALSPLGRAISAELSTGGHEVIGTSRSGERDTLRLDITDLASVRRVITESTPDVVISLARPTLDNPVTVEADVGVAVDSHARFAEVAAEHGVGRFIFASSAAVYGTGSAKPYAEDGAVDPGSPYAAVKLQTEIALETLAATSGLSTLALRIFNVYGKGFGGSLVNRLALEPAPGPELYLTDQFVRDYIHSTDVARAVRRAVEVASAEGVLNVGTGFGTSNVQLAALFPSAAYRVGGELAFPSFSSADVTRLRSTLGFDPQVSLTAAAAAPDAYLR